MRRAAVGAVVLAAGVVALAAHGCSGGGAPPDVCTKSWKAEGTFAPGDTIPGFALRMPAGGRADLKAKGTWANGQWTVMFTRARTNADLSDDVQLGVDFEPPAAGSDTLRYFSVAVLDNAGGAFDATMLSQNAVPYTLGNEGTAANLRARNATPLGPLDSASWGPAFVKPAGAGIAGTATAAAVTLRAAYDTVNFYLLAVWNDTTLDDRKQSWVFDGTTWTRRSDKGNDGSWATIDADGSQWDEDRLAIWWDISVSSVPNFSTNGCLALCHDHRMGVHNLVSTADLWHWKAARTNPMGFADDQRLATGTWDDAADMRGRSDDAGTGLDVANSGGSPAQPIYMAEADPGANARYLFLNTPRDSRYAIPYAAAGFNRGAVIPGWTLRAPVAGRADVRALGTWEAGQWKVMFTRALTTGWPTDDRQFDGLATGSLYSFSVAVLDNMGGAIDATMGSQMWSRLTMGDETLQPTAGLKAKKGTSPPSTNPGDYRWGPVFVKPAGLGIAGTATGAAVSLRAAYDSSNVYILAIWSDATKDDLKESVYFDGTDWIKRSDKGADGSWATIDADGSQWDEDRLAIWWDISVTGFASSGCLAMCHTQRMGSLTLGEKAGLWHWKAARTNPVGFADDQRLNDGTWSGQPMAGRSDDTGMGMDTRNTLGGPPFAPPYMADGDPNANARYLLTAPAVSRRAVPFRNSGFLAGAVLPGWALRPPTGGRADLRVSGSYAAGQWTVMFTRALTTPWTPDDVDFAGLPTGTTYPFSVAVLDNMGGANDATMTSQNTAPYTLGNATSGANLLANAAAAAPTPDPLDVSWGALFTKPAGVGIAGTATGASVDLRAAYYSGNFYLLAIWSDPDENNLKQSWIFDGTSWTRRSDKGDDGSWATNSKDGTQWDEDRLAIWWNISVAVGGTGPFSTQGCLTLCHDHRMGSHTLGEKADLWHWKAARTNPMNFADDQRLADGTWSGHSMAGRSDDTGTGIDVANISGSSPVYMADGDPGVSAAYLFSAWAGPPWSATTFVPSLPTQVETCVAVGSSAGGGGGVSFSQQIDPLFASNCSCHRGGNSQNGLNLDTYANLITGGNSGSEVLPGNGAGSLLYQKVSMDNPPVGVRMPFGGPYLSAAQQQTIKDWIDQGANNN